MNARLLVLHTFMAAFLLTDHHGQGACPTGWFGDRCVYQCHCYVSARCSPDDGSCPNNQCADKYFGPACQYYDIATESTPRSFLTDSNDLTCNPQTRTTSVKITWSRPYVFRWLRIVVKNARYLKGFGLKINKEECTNQKVFPAHDTAIDVECSYGHNLTELTLTGPAAGSVCSIYVTAGRNVALKQRVSQSSIYKAGWNYSLPGHAVDGNTSGIFGHNSCTHTESEADAWWRVDFNKSYVLAMIYIYNRDGQLQRLSGFMARTYDHNNEINVHTDREPTPLSVYKVNLFSPRPSTSLTITVSRWSGILTLCEVQAYGEMVCANGKYGLECEKYCSCWREQKCSMVTGACEIGCPQGTHGDNCTEICSGNCALGVCKRTSGGCFECKDGFRGEYCKEACPPGFFGATCVFQCNCMGEKGCSPFGECSKNVDCKRPYFGPGCQYVDYLQSEVAPSTPTFVRDNDETTCNPMRNARSLTLYLQRFVPVTWYRLHLSTNQSMFQHTTQVSTGEFCTLTYFRLSANVLDVVCGLRNNIVRTVMLEGAVVPYICSVRLSEGRNVALGQPANQSSDHPDSTSHGPPAFTVDGNITGTCSALSNFSGTSVWAVMFDATYVFQRIHIYTNKTTANWHSQYTLKAIGVSNDSADVVTGDFPKGAWLLNITLPSRKPVAGLQISSSKWPLVLCEVQAMGDILCPENRYGLRCHYECNCSGGRACNNITGTCALSLYETCPVGKHGKWCTFGCSPNCASGVCDSNSGHCRDCFPGRWGGLCDKDCEPGTFGANCRQTCSSQCLKPCNIKTGSCPCRVGFAGNPCTECVAGRHGMNCHLNCSKLCEDSLCHADSGECFACVENRTGPFCAGCRIGFFGVLCDRRCSRYCAGGRCDNETERCFSCVPGYKGEFCNHEIEGILPPVITLPIFVPPVVFFFICFILGGGHIEGGEEEDDD